MNNTDTPKYQSMTLYFGERHYEDKRELDHLTKSLRRSRTGVISFLLNYYKENEKRRVEPILI